MFVHVFCVRERCKLGRHAALEEGGALVKLMSPLLLQFSTHSGRQESKDLEGHRAGTRRWSGGLQKVTFQLT